MKSRELGRIWKNHYPHGDDHKYHVICISICSLLRSFATLEADGSYETRITRGLSLAGIPMEQFKECEAESKQNYESKSRYVVPRFIHREIDAINEKWREIQKAASVRAKRWQSFIGSTSIQISGSVSQNTWRSSAR